MVFNKKKDEIEHCEVCSKNPFYEDEGCMCLSQAEPSTEAVAGVRRIRIENGWIPPNPSAEEQRLVEEVALAKNSSEYSPVEVTKSA